MEKQTIIDAWDNLEVLYHKIDDFRGKVIKNGVLTFGSNVLGKWFKNHIKTI